MFCPIRLNAVGIFFSALTILSIISLPTDASAQENAGEKNETVELTGKVTDSNDGYPLIGVSVMVSGTNTGAATDIDGNFTLKIPDEACTIIFSYVGYETLEKEYNGTNASSFRKVVLTMNSTELNDVVVTGVYERKKESFTGSAATYKGDELKKVGTSSVLQSLRTLDPSFKIMESTQFGSDPNRMPDIEIRGKTSVAGLKEEYGVDPNQPLFILDGFETTLETVMNLNMNRVASVTILKDAASTAIYGSKAANGVVVIETKVPARGRLQVSYKGDFGISFADLTDYNLMNSSEKLQFETLAGVYTDKTNDPFNAVRLENLRNERLKSILREPTHTGSVSPYGPVSHRSTTCMQKAGKTRYAMA